MTDKPDFEKLRAERNAAMEKSVADVRKLAAEMFECDPTELLIHASGVRTDDCYCDCVRGGPCEHEFEGWREFEDGLGGEAVCKRCNMGAMGHDMWLFD